MATIIEDTFTNSDGTDIESHTMDTGDGWTKDDPASSIQISSNQVSIPTGTYILTDTGISDGTITVEKSGSWEDGDTVLFRTASISSSWSVEFVTTGGFPFISYSLSIKKDGVEQETLNVASNSSPNLIIILEGSFITISYGIYSKIINDSHNSTETKIGLQSNKDSGNSLFDSILLDGEISDEQLPGLIYAFLNVNQKNPEIVASKRLGDGNSIQANESLIAPNMAVGLTLLNEKITQTGNTIVNRESQVFPTPAEIRMDAGNGEIEIRYTTNGKLPTRNSKKYTGPITIYNAGKYKYRVKAFADNDLVSADSDTKTYEFILK